MYHEHVDNMKWNSVQVNMLDGGNVLLRIKSFEY
jgi:hypothetical protein